MRIIFLPRRAGKTTKIIEYLKNNIDSAILICVNLHFKNRIINKYPEIQNRVFTYNQYRSGKCRGLDFREIVIDNLDFFLYDLFYKKVSLVSITKEGE